MVVVGKFDGRFVVFGVVVIVVAGAVLVLVGV
jgi:hypothetical protein